MPELQRRQVLDDLAVLASNPRDLPYFALVYGGTANVTDQAGGSLGFLGVIGKYTQGNYGLSGQRQITGNWSLKPINDPYRLAAIRCACLIALNRDQMIEPIDLQRLNALLGQNYPGYVGNPRNVIPTGWLCSGDKHEMPKDWPYYAHSGDHYIWVKPDRFRDYTNFVLVVLDLATIAAGAARDLPQEVAPAKDDKTAATLKDLLSDLRLIKDQLPTATTQKAKKQLIDNAAEQQRQAEIQTGFSRRDNLKQFKFQLDDLQLDTAHDAPKASKVIQKFETALESEINHVQTLLDAQQKLQRQQPVRMQAPPALPLRDENLPFNPGLFFIPRT